MLNAVKEHWGKESLESLRMECRIRAKDKSERWILIRAVNIHDQSGRLYHVTIMAEDITEMKNAEKTIYDSEAKLRYLSTKLLETQEDERRRLATELHDNFGPSLAAVKFAIEQVKNTIGDHVNLQIKNTLTTAINQVKSIAKQTSHLQMDLRPSMLDELGLLDTIDWFCTEYQNIYSHIKVDLQLKITEGIIQDSLKIVIFRILQEALNNVAKHSQANKVTITFVRENDELRLSIEDNGNGFDPESILQKRRAKGGFGLVSMNERAEFSKGNFTLQTAPGEGVAVSVSWPLS